MGFRTTEKEEGRGIGKQTTNATPTRRPRSPMKATRRRKRKPRDEDAAPKGLEEGKSRLGAGIGHNREGKQRKSSDSQRIRRSRNSPGGAQAGTAARTKGESGGP